MTNVTWGKFHITVMIHNYTGKYLFNFFSYFVLLSNTTADLVCLYHNLVISQDILITDFITTLFYHR